MNQIEKYNQVFKDLFDVDDSALNDSFTFQNVDEWDSMTHLTLINELETAFDVMFETEDILHFGGYLNGIEILKRYGIPFSD